MRSMRALVREDQQAEQVTGESILEKAPAVIIIRIADVVEPHILSALPERIQAPKSGVPGYRCMQEEPNVYLGTLLEDLQVLGYWYTNGCSQKDGRVILLAFTKDQAQRQPLPAAVLPLLQLRAQFTSVYANECATTQERQDSINVFNLHTPSTKRRTKSQQLIFDGHHYGLEPLEAPISVAAANA